MTRVNSTPGHYDARFFLRAHYQLAGLTTVLRIVSLVAMTAGCFATPIPGASLKAIRAGKACRERPRTRACARGIGRCLFDMKVRGFLQGACYREMTTA
jgi:hypothetical protein